MRGAILKGSRTCTAVDILKVSQQGAAQDGADINWGVVDVMLFGVT